MRMMIVLTLWGWNPVKSTIIFMEVMDFLLWKSVEIQLTQKWWPNNANYIEKLIHWYEILFISCQLGLVMVLVFGKIAIKMVSFISPNYLQPKQPPLHKSLRKSPVIKKADTYQTAWWHIIGLLGENSYVNRRPFLNPANSHPAIIASSTSSQIVSHSHTLLTGTVRGRCWMTTQQPTVWMRTRCQQVLYECFLQLRIE